MRAESTDFPSVEVRSCCVARGKGAAEVLLSDGGATTGLPRLGKRFVIGGASAAELDALSEIRETPWASEGCRRFVSTRFRTFISASTCSGML